MKYRTKCWKHLKLVLRHKFYVFIACVEAGIPFRGLVHDMSKLSPAEFFSSAKYYTGDRSPIDNEKDDKGYSYAWLHHRGRNRHHWEYWIDNLSSGGVALKMPTKFVIEMICDWIGAGRAYHKGSWTKAEPFNVFTRKWNRGEIKIHIETYKFIYNVLYDYKNNLGDLMYLMDKYKNEYER